MSAKYRIGSLVEFNKDKYTEEEGEYKPYNEKYFEGKQGYVMAISDTKVSTAQSIEQLAESGNAEYMYKIKVGLSDIDNVPESDIFNPNENLTAKVEERLRKKQEGKTFSDTEGRIGGSAKEKSAYRLLKGQVYGLSDLEGIETDEATAIELIKKDKVYPKVDIEAERGKGVSSGATYLKVKLREAFGGEPPNDKNKRKIYVGYATYLTTAMESVFSVEDFQNFCRNKTINTGIQEIIKILKPELIEDIEDETAQKIKDKEYLSSKVSELSVEIEALEKNFKESNDVTNKLYASQKEVDIDSKKNSLRNYRNELYSIDVNGLTNIEAEFIKSLGFSRQGSNYVTRQIFTEVFSKRFLNFVIIGSEPVKETIETAKDYEALTLPESLMLIEKENSYNVERLEKSKEKIAKVNTLRGKDQYDDYFKGSEGDIGFSGGDFAKWKIRGNYFYYKDLKGEEQVLAYKKRYILGYEKRIAEYEKSIDAIKYKYRVRENNWEWAGAKKGKTTETDGKERSELKINTYPPLSFIKRTGGIKIEDSDITPVTIEKNGKKFATYPKIQEHFGFSNVELGQSLLDKEAKEHIRHFLGAMADFGDILNMNIVELNKLGGLSIAFASRGHGKASAHYEGLRKVINITKTRGGGAVAHEYMHYLDNILPKIDRAEYSYKEYASVIKEGRYGMRSAPVENKAVFKAIDNIFQYIYNRIMPSIDGDNRRTSEQTIVKVKKLINATDKGWQIPTRFSTLRTGAPKVPTDIDEYFNLFKERYSHYKRIENLKAKDISVLGAIVKKFGYKFYEFEFETRNSQYYANAIAMGSDYWSRAWELFARAFETYIFDKLDKLGRANSYLVSGDYFDRPEGIYPQGDERADLFLLYDALMQTIKREYNISDFKAWTNERVDEYFDIENDKETGVIVDDNTKKPVKVVHDKKPSKKETKKVAVKQKLKAFLELLETEKMETGGNLQNNYGYTDKLNEFLLTLQN
jgi:hypothetical protein